MSRIEQIITEIEDYIDSCKFQPLSNTKILVNKEEIEELLVELRLRIPEEIKKYQKIISNKDAILADAQNKADAIIAEGMESGGHIGQNTTMCLVPQVVDAVSVPVIAAGGIADGRGVAAAFMLGAEGVQVGTRFLATTECQIHENYKNLVLKAKDTDNAVTGVFSGSPCRGVKTKFTKKLLELEKKAAPPEDFEALTVGSLRKAVVDGNVEEGSFLCGLIAGMVHDVKPCAEVIQEMMGQAEKLLNR